MTAVAQAPGRQAARRAGPTVAPWRGLLRGIARHGEQLALFLVCYIPYLVVGCILIYRYDALPGDALSRLDDASNVLFSSNPHLAAIGFVWNPLPSLVEMIPLLLHDAWPDLLSRGLATSIISSGFMAWAVVGVRGILADRGAGRGARILLPLMFAVTPMVVLYGANGMSEAFFLAFLVWTCRSFLRYVTTRSSRDLVSGGVYLGLTYLTRYEAAGVALAVAVMIVLIGLGRPHRPDRDEVRSIGTDLLLGVGPFGLTFVGWAVASGLIVGSPFAQFSSSYGNSRQITSNLAGINAATGRGTARAYSYVAEQNLGLEPLALIVVLIALVIAVRRRSWFAAVPLVVFGSELAFSVGAFLVGDTFGWLRFSIMIVPLVACTLAAIVPVGPAAEGLDVDAAMAVGMRRGVIWLAVAACVLVAVPTELHEWANSDLSREEYANVYQPLHGVTILQTDWAAYGRVAAALDALHAGRGQILTEAADTVPVRTRTDDQSMFLDTTDTHFQRDLADPVRFGIKWILVAEPGLQYDSVDVQYPTVWKTGDGFGPLVGDFPGTPLHYRIYKVTATTTPGSVG